MEEFIYGSVMVVIPRAATTVPVDASCGGTICFDLGKKHNLQIVMDQIYKMKEYLQYKIPGGLWTDINYFSPIGFPYRMAKSLFSNSYTCSN